MMTREDLMSLHDEVCRNAKTTMEKKNHDYTSASADPFANFRGSQFIGIHPVKGILMRMMDKMKRIQTFAERGNLKVDGEGFRDAVEDMVNYAILIRGMLEEQADAQGL